MPDYTSDVRRTGPYEFVATASSGAEVRMATKGTSVTAVSTEGRVSTEPAFSPVELFLAALGGCAAFGVERFVTRRAGEPVQLDVHLTGDLEGPTSSRLARITVTYAMATDDGPVPEGLLADAVHFAHTRSCTVSLALHDPPEAQLSPGRG